jgi:hypothetical protein
MNGIYNIGVADDVKRLRRDLIELKEIVRLGAGIPGDKLSSTLRILYRVAERFHESFPEGGWNFHVIPVVPGH